MSKTRAPAFVSLIGVMLFALAIPALAAPGAGTKQTPAAASGKAGDARFDPLPLVFGKAQEERITPEDLPAHAVSGIFAALLIPLMPLAAQTSPTANDDQEGQRLLAALKQSIAGEYQVGSAKLLTKVSGEACFTRLSRTNTLQPTVSYGGGLMRWEGFDRVEVNPLQKQILILRSSYMTNTGISGKSTDLMLDTPERADAAAKAMNALISHCKARRARLDSEKPDD